jgi:AraC-like DNA-binding protein
MTAPEPHRSIVLGSPWKGVYCTHIESGHRYGRHWHATYGFGLVEHGAQSSASGRGKVEAYAGDVITTNPGEVHDGHPLGGPSRRWRIVYLEPAAMASVVGMESFEITRPVIRDARLARALRQLFARLERAGSDVLACEEALVRACARLADTHTTAGTREAPGDARQIRERLADDLLNAPTLSELASMAGLSKYQVLRRFERAYGLPPHAWLLQQRAERARRLIEAGSSLAAAAASSGFADQSHLSRVFVRHFGFTPGAWKQAVLQ